MTDRQKVKQAIAVLAELERRYFTDKLVPVKNLIDLRALLEVPHAAQIATASGSEGGHQLALRLHRHILKRKVNYRGVDVSKWAVEMDRIVKIDNRTPAMIAEVIDWCQQDDFWMNNILSPSKLRKQLDRLELQMGRDFNWNKRKLKRRTQDGPTAKDKYMEELNANSQGPDG